MSPGCFSIPETDYKTILEILSGKGSIKKRRRGRYSSKFLKKVALKMAKKWR
jgi:hypothetical protein